MSTEQSSAVLEHLHTVTPRLVVRDAVRAIDFYQAALPPRKSATGSPARAVK